MLTTILIIVGLVIVVLAIVIAVQPSTFRISRSVTVNAPASAAFAQVNDFRKWESWSPWEKVDPNTKKTYEGSPSGVGAKYAWAGNRQVGEGRMTILENRPNELIRIRLEFLKPMKATHMTDFTFAQSGNQTVVTQSMYGKNNFLAKAMHLVMNMETMIGPMFEKGLSQLKTVAETGGRQ